MRFSSRNTERADANGRNYVVNIGGRLGWWEQTEEKERGEESEPFQRDGFLTLSLATRVIPRPSKNSRKCHEEDG